MFPQGLSNFGGGLGGYFGVGLMEAFGLGSHQYEGLSSFVLTRSLFRLIPLILIPFLVPEGSPDSPPSRKADFDEHANSTEYDTVEIQHLREERE